MSMRGKQQPRVVDRWHRKPRNGEVPPHPGDADKVAGSWCMEGGKGHPKPGTAVCTARHGIGMRWAVQWKIDGKETSESFPTEVQANARRVQVTSQLFTGTYVDPKRSQVPFREVAEKWFAEVKAPSLKESSRCGERSRLDHSVLKRWGDVPLDEITYADVQAWFTWMVTDPDARTARTENVKKRTVNRPLAQSTAVKAYQILRQVLAYAVDDGRLPHNVADRVTKPRAKRTPKEIALTHDQVAKLVEAAGEFGPVFLTLAYTAVRFGELAALRVGDVDLENRLIDVSKGIVQVSRGPEVPPGSRARLIEGSTKTDQGDDDGRVVPILTNALADALRRQVEGRSPAEYLFPGPDGGPLRNSYVRYRLDRACKSAGLPPIRIKTLRHTGGSLALKVPGTTIVTVSKMMGHSNTTTTANVYMKMLPNDFAELAEGMEATLRAEGGSDGVGDKAESSP